MRAYLHTARLNVHNYTGSAQEHLINKDVFNGAN